MSPELTGIIGIIILLFLIFLQFPVGLALFLVGFLGVMLISGWDVAVSQLSTSTFSTVNDYGLSVIPLFVLMGMFMTNTGLGKDLFEAVDKWMGHLRGGLAMAAIGASSIFAAISGSTNATTATLGRVAIPEMDHYNYNSSFSASAVAAGGTLGILIPPSVILILYGALTSEPIGPLLIAGLIPGLALAFLFMLTINLQVRINPEKAPRKEEKVSLSSKFSSLNKVWPFLVIFIISIGGIYFGVFTPTEAGSIGAMATFVLTLLTGKLSFSKLRSSLDEAIRLSVMIFLILIGATLFGRFLALSKIPMQLAANVSGLEVNAYIIISLILIVYVLLGMFMEGLAIMVLTLPIVYPIVIELGFDGVWFGVIIVMALNIGLLTPPLGLSVYIISGILKDTPIENIFKGVLPMVITMLIFTVILIIFPEIVTFVPQLMN
ncbi:TRAP transporter large permease [Salibacterium aidingense]|uniref:TRAP transporter large permease n=1 Tax=Salibacterium aidingense TaxID=384933 RepID=UPI00041D28E6|nr:TRAP transporter large permease [Salibacterium aidingense]